MDPTIWRWSELIQCGCSGGEGAGSRLIIGITLVLLCFVGAIGTRPKSP